MTPDIRLTRIDNRLLHGQGITWAATYNANLVVVVDDETAHNQLAQELMKIAAESAGVGVRFFTVEKTIQVIHKASESQHIFLICKTPHEVEKLIKGGVPIERVNVGNMHFSQGKKQLSKKVYADENELKSLDFIKSQVKELFIQDVPGDAKERL